MSLQESQSFSWHYPEFSDKNFEIRGHTFYIIVIFFFALLISITLLFLYSRWVYRYQSHRFPIDPPLHAPHASPLRPQGLDPTFIKALPITLHQSSSSSSSSAYLGESNGTVMVAVECSICLEVFEDGDKVKVLPKCHHCFHGQCVDMWLTTQSSCPLCRASLLLDSPAVSILTQ